MLRDGNFITGLITVCLKRLYIFSDPVLLLNHLLDNLLKICLIVTCMIIIDVLLLMYLD